MASSLLQHRNLAFAAALSFLVGASSIHCGSSGNATGTFTGNGGSGGNGQSGGPGSSVGGNTSSLSGGVGGENFIDVQTKDYSAEDFFNSNPPPMTCDGGGMVPVVTGTPECPSDKNLPGCGCATEGMTAACWTGLRKNRDHGDCKDGTTTCTASGETQLLTWGPCNGEILPTGTTGKAACECFSSGHWQIDNLSPCFYSSTDGSGNQTSGAISTVLDGGQAMCPASFDAAPTDPWSTDSLNVDCAGSFTLCYTIKAGNGSSPQPTDCVMAKSCVSAYYPTANQPFTLPPLPSWISDASMSACVAQFQATGGYGEMSVDGQSDECELVNKIFQHVTYCPLACNEPNPPAMCASCSNGGGGTF